MDAFADAHIVWEATVLRAVPCAAHTNYQQECPDCLTGEEAYARKVAGQETQDLGVIAEHHPRKSRRQVSRLLRRN